MSEGRLFYVMGNGPGLQQELVLDVVLSQGHGLDSDVTQDPVEQGVNFTDHIQPKAEQVQLEAVISDAPLGETPTPGRARDAMATLIAIRDSGTLVTLQTTRRNLPDCALASLHFAFDYQGGSVVRFQATLQQIRIVETKTAKLIRKQVAVPNAKDKVMEGNKASTPADDDASPLYSLIEATGVIKRSGATGTVGGSP